MSMLLTGCMLSESSFVSVPDFSDTIDASATGWTLPARFSVVSSPFGGFGIQSTNGTTPTQTAYKSTGLSSDPILIRFDVKLVARGTDDVPFVSIGDDNTQTGGEIVFTAARQSATDASRRAYFIGSTNGIITPALTIGGEYHVEITLDGIGSATGRIYDDISFDQTAGFSYVPQNAAFVTILDQTLDTTGSIIFDNIEIFI